MKNRYAPKTNSTQPRATKVRGKKNTSMHRFHNAEQSQAKYRKQHGVQTLSKNFYNENVSMQSAENTSTKEWKEVLKPTYLLVKHINKETSEYFIESHILRKNGSITRDGLLSYRISPNNKKMRKTYEKDKKNRLSLKEKYVSEVILGSENIIDVLFQETKVLKSSDYRNDKNALNRAYDFKKIYKKQLSRIKGAFLAKAINHVNQIKTSLKLSKETYDKGIEFTFSNFTDLNSSMLFRLGGETVQTSMYDFLDGVNDVKITTLLLKKENDVKINKKMSCRKKMMSSSEGSLNPTQNFILVANKAQNKVLTIMSEKDNIAELINQSLARNCPLKDFIVLEKRTFDLRVEEQEDEFEALSTKYRSVLGKYVNVNRYKVLREHTRVQEVLEIRDFDRSYLEYGQMIRRLPKMHKKSASIAQYYFELSNNNFDEEKAGLLLSDMKYTYSEGPSLNKYWSLVCDNTSEAREAILTESKDAQVTDVLGCCTSTADDVSTRGSHLYNTEAVVSGNVRACQLAI